MQIQSHMLCRHLVILLLGLCHSAALYAVNEGDKIPNGGIPFSVAIVYRTPDGGETVCGGLMFAGGCVLTAAHCIKPPGSVYEIYQGTTISPENLLTIGGSGEAMSTKEKDWPDHDIGMIKLHGAPPAHMTVPIKNLYTKKLGKGAELGIAGPGQNRSHINEDNEVVYEEEFGSSHQGTVTFDKYDVNPTGWGWLTGGPRTVIVTKRGKTGQSAAPGDSGSSARYQRVIQILPFLKITFPEKYVGVTSMVVYDHDESKPRQPEDIKVGLYASFMDKKNMEWIKATVEKLGCEHNSQEWVKKSIQNVITKNIQLDLMKKRRKFDEADLPSSQFAHLKPETKRYMEEQIRKLANVSPTAPVKIGSPIRTTDYGLYFPVDITLNEEVIRFHMTVPFPKLTGTPPLEFAEGSNRQATR